MGVQDQAQCKWIYEHVKCTKLVAKSYAQTYGIDYEETYSSIVRMVTITIIFTMGTTKGQSLYQMNVKNTILHRDL
jgi:hypothetical protein